MNAGAFERRWVGLAPIIRRVAAVWQYSATHEIHLDSHGLPTFFDPRSLAVC